MKIEVLLFAQLRDAFGEDRMVVDVHDGEMVGELSGRLMAERTDGRLASLPFSFAVNEEFVGADHVLNEGDILALIPPVSGG